MKRPGLSEKLCINKEKSLVGLGPVANPIKKFY